MTLSVRGEAKWIQVNGFSAMLLETWQITILRAASHVLFGALVLCSCSDRFESRFEMTQLCLVLVVILHSDYFLFRYVE